MTPKKAADTLRQYLNYGSDYLSAPYTEDEYHKAMMVALQALEEKKQQEIVPNRCILSIVHSEQREIDVQKLCKAVLDTSPNCWDNPNGAYETTCPFCYVEEHRGGGKSSIWASMSELDHKSGCAYLIAKDLSTNCL